MHLQMRCRVSHLKKPIMYKVLHVPQLACNLFSVRTTAAKGAFIQFGHFRCWIRDSEGKLNGMGTLINKL